MAPVYSACGTDKQAHRMKAVLWVHTAHSGSVMWRASMNWCEANGTWKRQIMALGTGEQ